MSPVVVQNGPNPGYFLSFKCHLKSRQISQFMPVLRLWGFHHISTRGRHTHTGGRAYHDGGPTCLKRVQLQTGCGQTATLLSITTTYLGRAGINKLKHGWVLVVLENNLLQGVVDDRLGCLQ